MPKKIILLTGAVVVLLAIGTWQFVVRPSSPDPVSNNTSSPAKEPEKKISAPLVVAKNLEIPWDIAFLPDGNMLVTERTGSILKMKPDGTSVEISTAAIRKNGEGGLLGVTLHPKFSQNHLVYFYMTAPGQNGNTENRVERYKFENNQLSDKKLIISGIPGAIYHDGGRMEFGPDGLLYITTGDATKPAIAQDKKSLGGKILRLGDDGSIPKDNPFGTAIYSYGHRNPQGLAWDSAGRLWETEHARSGALSGLDEINLIKPGANYGWPDIEGDKVKTGMVTPEWNSGASVTWAPASLVYLKGNLFFGGLMGESLYKATLKDDKVVEVKSYFKGEFGRIRTVRLGPDGMLYLTTSNQDGRGTPTEDDDRIIKVDPASLN